MQKYRRNLPILYIISLLQGVCFYAPIASLYRQAAGLNLTQIALIESISFLFTLAMELPWGVLADRIGYRRAMIAANGLFFLSKLVFWRADGFGAFLLERFLLSAAIAGLSGVDESILYLSTGEANAQRAFGRWAALGQVGLFLSAIVYARFIGENYRLAALGTAISYGLAFLLCFLLAEVRPEEARERTSLASFTACLRDTLRKRRLLLLLVSFTLYDAAVQMTTVWLNQNLYLRGGMTTSGIGWAYLLIPLAGMMGALSDRCAKRLGEGRLAALCFGLSAAACACLARTRLAALAVACVTLVAVCMALLGPVIALAQNREATAADRATQLSAFALVQEVAAAGASLGLGRAADASLSAAMLLCAAACAVGLAGYAAYRKRSEGDS